MPLRVSTEYVNVTLAADPASLAALSTSSIHIMVTDQQDTATGSWHTADTYAAPLARILVGPAGTVPWPTGPRAHIFVKLDAAPESPVIYAGELSVVDES